MARGQRKGKNEPTKRHLGTNKASKIKRVAEILRIPESEAKKISKGKIDFVSPEKLSHPMLIKQKEGKYYKSIAGIEVEINRFQFAGIKRSMNRVRDEKGQFISQIKDTRFKKAAKNAGAENVQQFVKKNINQLNKYPKSYSDELHIGSAIKAAASFKDFKGIRINGEKTSFIDFLKFLVQQNKNIDSAQKAKKGTPNIFIKFDVDEDKMSLNVFYDDTPMSDLMDSGEYESPYEKREDDNESEYWEDEDDE